jgi:hypothetical protein
VNTSPSLERADGSLEEGRGMIIDNTRQEGTTSNGFSHILE